MKPVHFLLAAVALAVLGLQSASAEVKPNIVFILADDLGYGDLKCYGHPYARTPNLDKLAEQGTRFTQCYATGVTCCPSRTGFMTGKFPATFAKYPAGAGFGGRVTITELLNKQGYATGHFGKWHIGPVTEDGAYGIDTIGAAEDAPGGKKKRKRKAAAAARGRDAGMYDAAIRFIEQHKDGPFYINIWDHIPHHPVNPSQAVVEAFGPLEVDESKFPPQMREKFAICKKLGGDVSAHMRSYLAEVKAMDAEIGALLKKLDELGLRENTLIAFSSDQGAGQIRESIGEPNNKKPNKPKKNGGNNTPDIRLNAMGFSGPFKGGKHDQYEGGVRIPWIVRWPGHVPAGRVDEKAVLSGADWLPTLCILTGVKFDASSFDGEDASDAWLGRNFTRTKPLMWKTSAAGSDPALRVANWKFHGAKRKKGVVELYDLATDPGESTNLAGKKPEIVRQLSETLNTWTASLPKRYDKTDETAD
jgi:N-acetylgalactosamine-6-sulfatase